MSYSIITSEVGSVIDEVAIGCSKRRLSVIYICSYPSVVAMRSFLSVLVYALTKHRGSIQSQSFTKKLGKKRYDSAVDRCD